MPRIALKNTFDDADDEQAVQTGLLNMRMDVIDSIWMGMTTIAAIGIPISVSRALITGWLPLYTIHLLIGAIVIVATLVRNRFSFRTKVAVIMCGFWSIGLSGLFTIGLLGPGLWWLAMSGLIMSMMFSFREGLITIFFAAIATLLAGAGFITNFLSFPIDANIYMRTPVAWVTLLIALSFMPIVVFNAITRMHSHTIALLNEAHAQKKKIQLLATHDQLTGVPSLSLAMDRLAHALLNIARSEKSLALLFIDLDKFKAVNDHYGHAAGDFVLKEVARRCAGTMRADDTMARIGGDEFLAILQGIANPQDAIQIAQKIIDAVHEPIVYQGMPIQIGTSVGVATCNDPTKTAQELLKAADDAMYRAKRSGTNQIAISSLMRDGHTN